MNDNEHSASSAEIQPERERDYGKPLVVEWADSEWFQVWLKLARHEDRAAA